MRYKTLLAERSQSTFARWAPVPKPTTVVRARNACREAPVSAKIGRFVFRQTGRAELQPGRLNPWCATLLRRPQGQTQPGQGVRSNTQSRDVFQRYAGMLPQKPQDAISNARSSRADQFLPGAPRSAGGRAGALRAPLSDPSSEAGDESSHVAFEGDLFLTLRTGRYHVIKVTTLWVNILSV